MPHATGVRLKLLTHVRFGSVLKKADTPLSVAEFSFIRGLCNKEIEITVIMDSYGGY